MQLPTQNNSQMTSRLPFEVPWDDPSPNGCSVGIVGRDAGICRRLAELREVKPGSSYPRLHQDHQQGRQTGENAKTCPSPTTTCGTSLRQPRDRRRQAIQAGRLRRRHLLDPTSGRRPTTGYVWRACRLEGHPTTDVRIRQVRGLAYNDKGDYDRHHRDRAISSADILKRRLRRGA